MLALAGSVPAVADEWFPHPANATWKYFWNDSTYNKSGTTETVTVKTESATCGWQLSWSGPNTTITSGNSQTVVATPDSGTMCFEDQNFGLINTDWSSTPPPSNMPILCASASQCPNSLASALYQVIWGNRVPVLSEPLLQGTTWSATGGGSNEVTSSSQYLGLRTIKVPAFPNGVTAAVVRSQLALGGTPGDDYGSGIRTIWWVLGVGPVRVVFDHVDGSVTNVYLQSTNQTPLPPRPDQNYFPMRQGLKNTYQWTNHKLFRQPEIETTTFDAVANRSARLSVRSVSGPMRAVGVYLFADRVDGVRSTYGSASAATLVKFPPLGHGKHFLTPIDMMTYGFNPVLPAYPVPGSVWHSGNAYDYQVYGVSGMTKVIGIRTVHVPAGTFQALELQSTLNQSGHRFGSGTRTMWFSPTRGLVKLVFHHRDGSTSVVTLLK
jgi:hypothetical protein